MVKLPVTITKPSAKPEEFEKVYFSIAQNTPEQMLQKYGSSIEGLKASDAAIKLKQYGPNQVSSNKKTPWFIFLIKSFLDEFILVLLLLGVISFIMQDQLGAGIIFLLAAFSATLRFVQDYSAYLSSEKLKTMIHTMVDVRRNNSLTKVSITDIVPGDIVELGPGSIVPADIYVLESKDLFLSQSMFTGESAPVEKKSGAVSVQTESTALSNICLMGSNVVSGSGVALVVKTGKSTYLGTITKTVESKKGQTNFEQGLSKVTSTLVRYMVFVVLCVFVINGIVKKDWLQAFMFSVSVAVGITPGMLPMIVNATLSKGAQFLAKKKTIVKNMSSIQNLGAIDVLCTDKTGTLTVDSVELQRYMNINGVDDIKILDYAFLNSYFSTGIKNLIDNAIIAYGNEHKVKEDVASYKKIDEIPFDYDRKRMSVVIEDTQGKHRIITKGAVEEILKICTSVQDTGGVTPLAAEQHQRVIQHANELNNDGMHVIGIAEKIEQVDISTFCVADESQMTFIGYVAFLDPPKPDVKVALEEIYTSGVEVKVLTGDAPLVAEHICRQVGMRQEGTLTGAQIEEMDDAQLKKAAETTNIFARLAPMQKARVVTALRQNGHVVGYMGDGVNDAPSLRQADVGISVDTATDIAKESSDIILLEKNLTVIRDGIYEGRRIYGNIMKYMKMALSSNFGNVFSVLVASLFLPFLPMIPIQILIQNLIYDFTQIAIPWDNMDEEFLEKPHKWDIKGLSSFMNTMGVTSSVFDMATFACLWFVLGFNVVAKQEFFQTGWFIEGLISQTLIVHFIRTSKIPFIQSRANIRLTLSTLGGIMAAIGVPYLLHRVTGFNFVIMPSEYYMLLAAILIGYAVSIELVKKVYIKRKGSWL